MRQSITSMVNIIKHYGRVYTPNYLVSTILNFGNYIGTDILCKHVIDFSCGDGSFLTEIVDRYCHSYQGVDLKYHLETYIHGIEIDREECEKCKQNLSQIAAKNGIKDVQWDIICDDALLVDCFQDKMDFVFGNPPYVRVHNLNTNYNNVKRYSFTQQGMTDLYLAFFELGFQMMNKYGTMCIITPSSWFSSTAGGILRQYIVRHHNLSGIIDLGHFQPFKASTYTAISRFNAHSNSVKFYKMTDDSSPLIYVDTLSIDDIWITNNFYFSDKESLAELNAIRNSITPYYVEVKNGFATLADRIFIGDFTFDGCIIDVLKASTGEWKKCIFPYDRKGFPLPIEEIKKTYKSVYEYLLLHQNELKEGPTWYLYGRTQAIKDVYKRKLALNTIIKDKNSIRLESVEAGSGVYSGLYILTDLSESVIRNLIVSDNFVKYVRLLANYKSGGYYTFSSKDVAQYLNYKLAKEYQ